MHTFSEKKQGAKNICKVPGMARNSGWQRTGDELWDDKRIT